MVDPGNKIMIVICIIMRALKFIFFVLAIIPISMEGSKNARHLQNALQLSVGHF